MEQRLAFCSAATSIFSIAFKACFPLSPGFWVSMSALVAPTHFKAALVEVPKARDPVEAM